MATANNDTALTTLKEKVSPALQQAQDLIISSRDDYQQALELVKGVKVLIKQIEEHHKPIKKKLDEAKKTVLDQEKALLSPLQEAERLYKKKMGDFDDAEEAKAQEAARKEEERIQKLRDKALEKVNARLDKLKETGADIDRQIADLEAMLQDPELTELEAAAINTKIDSLMVSKNKVESNIQAAAEKVEEVALPSAASVPYQQPKTEGMSSSKTFDVEIVNPLAVVKAIAAGNLAVGVVKSFDLSLLKRLVNAGQVIPGVKATPKRDIRVRTN